MASIPAARDAEQRRRIAQRADTLVFDPIRSPNGYGNNMGGFGGPRMGRRAAWAEVEAAAGIRDESSDGKKILNRFRENRRRF